MRRRSVIVGAGLALLAAVAGVLALARPSGEHEQSVRSAPERTVLVVEGGAALPTEPFYGLRDCLGNPTVCENGADGIVLAYAVAGMPPPRRSAATVLSDENCEPDRYGVSHCLNRLRLADGRTLTVRHDHNMGNDPCLSPGERVVVRALV